MELETLEDYEEDVENFTKYLEENHPEFPKDMSKILLSKFLKTCNRDYKESAKLLGKHIDIRLKNEDIFLNRDYFDEKSISARNTVQFVHFPKLTKDGLLLSLHKIADLDPKKFEIFDIVKADVMAIDIVQASMMNDVIPDHEIAIIDGAGLTFKHVLKFMGSLWHMKVFIQFLQDAVPYFLKECHIVNVSSFVKHAYALVKPFINSKTEIFLHNSSDELLKIFEKDDLPEEYGGNLGKWNDLFENHYKYLETNVNVLKQYNFMEKN